MNIENAAQYYLLDIGGLVTPPRQAKRQATICLPHEFNIMTHLRWSRLRVLYVGHHWENLCSFSAYAPSEYTRSETPMGRERESFGGSEHATRYESRGKG